MSIIKVEGYLNDWFNKGYESTYWAICLDDPKSQATSFYQQLFLLEKNDRLEVYDTDGKLVLDVIVDPDYEAGYSPYPQDPIYGQSMVSGLAIYWTQKGWNCDDWARLFIPRISKQEYLARLLKIFETYDCVHILKEYNKTVYERLSREQVLKFEKLRQQTVDSFRLRGIVTREDSFFEGANMQLLENRNASLQQFKKKFEAAGRLDLLESSLTLGNEDYFTRQNLIQNCL
jgi:hypothetical protein